MRLIKNKQYRIKYKNYEQRVEQLRQMYAKQLASSVRSCRRCKISFVPLSLNHWYCGSRKTKTGCSYVIDFENRKVIGKRYYENHRATYNKRRLELRFSVLKKFNFTCQYCGAKAPDVKLEVDHIVPKAKGGVNDISNLTVACKDCNLGKSDSILNEFQWQDSRQETSTK